MGATWFQILADQSLWEAEEGPLIGGDAGLCCDQPHLLHPQLVPFCSSPVFGAGSAPYLRQGGQRRVASTRARMVVLGGPSSAGLSDNSYINDSINQSQAGTIDISQGGGPWVLIMCCVPLKYLIELLKMGYHAPQQSHKQRKGRVGGSSPSPAITSCGPWANHCLSFSICNRVIVPIPQGCHDEGLE